MEGFTKEMTFKDSSIGYEDLHVLLEQRCGYRKHSLFKNRVEKCL